MNEITMIPIDRLMHHPENPRLDLGDLSELAESIRQNGIMQNLTVVAEKRILTDEEWTSLAQRYTEGTATEADRVKMNSRAGGQEPKPVETGKYLVVIGNRRMEASKIAGLQELPCVISDMSHEEQISTMLQENMQRSDLTVFEQAQGFQMMMNLGFTQEQIAEKTGISQTTVRRRLKMAELNPKVLKEKCAEQIGMGVFEKIAQIDDVKERNELLEKAGCDNFNWCFTQALRRQKTNAVLPEAKKKIREVKAKKIERSQTWNGDYEKIGSTIYLYDWDGKSSLISKAAMESDELFYYLEGSELEFYIKRKRAAPVRKTEEEKAKEKAVADAWEQYKRDTKMAAELRRIFVDGMTVSKATWLRHFMRMVEAASLGELNYRALNTRLEELYCVQGIHYEARLRKVMENTYELVNEETIPHFILAFYEGEQPDRLGYGDGWQKEMPYYKENPRLDACYDWLKENGYKMSDVEKQLQDGTHPSFARKSQ